MKIKEVKANIVLDSRGQQTIEIVVNDSGITKAPAGKSTGKYEKKPYKKDVGGDCEIINKLKLKSFPEIK
ncbi:MAG: hypothetical protein AABY22_08040, partial [Nanoarchaeota archaeon]